MMFVKSQINTNKEGGRRKLREVGLGHLLKVETSSHMRYELGSAFMLDVEVRELRSTASSSLQPGLSKCSSCRVCRRGARGMDPRLQIHLRAFGLWSPLHS
jgi:hypothetical protein